MNALNTNTTNSNTDVMMIPVTTEVAVDGDPAIGHKGDVTCTDRWRAVNADKVKGMSLYGMLNK